MLKPALAAHFKTYADTHRQPQSPVIRSTLELAIPLIAFHVLAMLSWIVIAAPAGRTLTLAHLAYVGIVGWYLSLDAGLGVLMALLFALCFPIAAITPRAVVVLIAVAGWGLQLAGRLVRPDRRSARPPAFFTKLLQALIGPLYFVARLVGIDPGGSSVA
jgi:uncharacterized membrane protein YGL010W